MPDKSLPESNQYELPSQSVTWAVWAVLVAILLPMFLRMPLTNDTVLYDLQARWIGEGAVPYSDYIEPNLPGAVWIHQAIRSIVGQSSEAFRLFDFSVLTFAFLTVGHFVADSTQRRRTAAGAIVFATLCYLTQSEWCHTQRDSWLLFPTVLACFLRWKNATKGEKWHQSTLWGLSILEGTIWGVAIWLKPHIIFVIVAVWLIGWIVQRDMSKGAVSSLGLFIGGLIMGTAGIAWFIIMEAWDPFVETVLDWNPGYVAARKAGWTRPRIVAMVVRMSPWIWLHFIAIPSACRALCSLKNKHNRHEQAGPAILSAAYLAWIAQSVLTQHLFDYVHLPAILLAVFVIAMTVDFTSTGWKWGLRVFAVVALLSTSQFQMKRLALWRQCVTGPNSAQLQDELMIFENPVRTDMEEIKSFLSKELRDGETFIVFNSDMVSMYWDLDQRAPTRFVYAYELLEYFPERKEHIQRDLLAKSPRFMVTDLVSCGMPVRLAEEIGRDGAQAPPPAYKRIRLETFPWNYPVVFREGRYLVHDLKSPVSANALPVPSE